MHYFYHNIHKTPSFPPEKSGNDICEAGEQECEADCSPGMPCTPDADCYDDGNNCTANACTNGTCAITVEDDCCGNFVCEAGEQACPDCGPFELAAPACVGTCWIPSGLMFDVTAIDGINLIGLSFQVYSRNPGRVNDVVTVYTASGSYNDHYNDRSSWTEVTSQSISAEEGEFV